MTLSVIGAGLGRTGTLSLRTTRQGRPDVLGELAPEYKVFKPVGHRLLGRFSFEGRRSTAPLRQALRVLIDLSGDWRRWWAASPSLSGP